LARAYGDRLASRDADALPVSRLEVRMSPQGSLCGTTLVT
jgi:hypothetical protein